MADQLGALVRRFRNRAGLTQEQLAERAGVSVRTIRRLEGGKANNHRLETVNMLADALELGPEESRQLVAVLAGTEDQPSPPPPEPPSRRPEPSPVPAVLADTAAELAREVKRRWRREEEQRRVHDPRPLPVRWQELPRNLMDHPENVQRLEAGAAPSLMDLSGEVGGVAEVYRKIPSGRLVILGRAGSGKSILTIRFVLDFLETRAPSDPVPVIFSAGSWDPTAMQLRDWLIARLLRDHPHLARRVASGATLAAALVDADLVLPVLDGFDEIAEGLRKEALDALNTTSVPLVLTSRRSEFEEAVRAAGTPPVWAAGIELADLTVDDLADYLPLTARNAPVWDRVLAELQAGGSTAGTNLGRVLSTPLMVILARTMYSDSGDRDPAGLRDPAELLDGSRFPTQHSLEEHLLAGFVPAVYRPRPPARTGSRAERQRNWDVERAQRWLGYLAHHLVSLDRERQDLAWWQLPESLRRSTRIAAVMLMCALCVAGTSLLVDLAATPIGFGEALVQGALIGPGAGLAFGLVYGIVTFGGEILEPARVWLRLRLPGVDDGIGRWPVRTFAKRFTIVLPGGFVTGVGAACAFALQRALYHGDPLTGGEAIERTLVDMLVLGLVGGVGAGLVFGLLAVLEAPLDVASAATPLALLSADRATAGRQIAAVMPLLTLTIGFGGQLVVDLLQGLLGPLDWELSTGLVTGAMAGLGGAFSYVLAFTAWGQWLVLARLWLPLTGRLPWNTAAFLDDAYRRGVLRQTGAVYQFRHIRLQHHLAHAFRQRQSAYAPARFAATVDQG